MFNIAICDDCPHQVDNLVYLLKQYLDENPDKKYNWELFHSGEELLASLDCGNYYDLYLLDIILPEKNGIDLAKDIRARDITTHIIFSTASADYALSAFDVSAYHYLLKPIDTEKLFPVLDKIISLLELNDECFFMFPASGCRFVKVPFSSIVCAELANRTIVLYLTTCEELRSKTLRTSFLKTVAPLLEDNRFINPHKSYIVNMDWIEELTGKSFIIKGNREIFIPRYRYTEAKKKYFSHLSQRGINMTGIW